MDSHDKTKETLLNELQELREENTFLRELCDKEHTLRNHSDEALRETNIKLTSALEGANMAWWEMDVPTGNVTFDKRKVEMLGYPPENFRHYKDFTALVHPKDYERIMKAMRGHFNGTFDKYEAEYRILASSGEYIWFYDYGSVVKRDANGNPLICTGFVFNITDKKKEEEKFRLISKAVESTSDAIAISDSLGHHYYHNKALSNLFGYETAEELEASGGGIAIVKDPAIAKQMVETILHGKSLSGELEMVTKSGRVFPAYGRTDAITDEVGNIIGIIGIIKDITEQKQAEEKLRENENKLQAIFDTVGAGIIIIDKKSKCIIEANETTLKMTGLSKEQILNHICHSLVCSAEVGKCPVKDLGETIEESERKLLCADGKIKDILKTVYPITIKGRDCYLESFIDITERKQVEQALNKRECSIKCVISFLRWECNLNSV